MAHPTPFSIVITDILNRGDAARISRQSGINPGTISRYKSADRIPDPESAQKLLDAVTDRKDRDSLLLAYIRTVAPPRESRRISVVDQEGVVLNDEAPALPTETERDLAYLAWLAGRSTAVRTQIASLAEFIRSYGNRPLTALTD